MADPKKDPLDGLDPELREHLAGQIGPRVEHPEGRLTDDDDGLLRMAVGEHRGNVILAFGVEVGWVGLGPAAARELAEALCRRAESIDGVAARVCVPRTDVS